MGRVTSGDDIFRKTEVVLIEKHFVLEHCNWDLSKAKNATGLPRIRTVLL